MPIKILAIDDSKTMRLAIKITFAAEDAEVTSVSKGSEAVARAKQMAADVVLVDAKLAEGEPSGYEVCRALKSDSATANMPVILLVSNQDAVDMARVREVGGDAVLSKPFDTQELIDKVTEVVGKPVARTFVKPAEQVSTVAMAVGSPAPVAPSVASVPLAASASTPGSPRPSLGASSPTLKPAPAPAASRPAAPSRGSGGPSSGDGEIPIAIPIPFTAAEAPTAGMLRRLQEAVPGDPLDPAVVAALLTLSREVIEQVVWEVVPELAESIIRKQAKQVQSA